MNKTKKSAFILKMVELAMLTAIILVLQLTGTAIKFGETSINLVLIPIVLGALLLGPSAGAYLGFISGAIVYFSGVFGADPFTLTLFNAHPLLTALVCFGKGIASGWVPGIIYKLLKNKLPYISVLLASATAPIVNTGLFILGAFTMTDTISTIAADLGMSVFYFLVIFCAGLNFVFEFILNIVVSPAIHRIISIVNKKLTVERYY